MDLSNRTKTNQKLRKNCMHKQCTSSEDNLQCMACIEYALLLLDARHPARQSEIGYNSWLVHHGSPCNVLECSGDVLQIDNLADITKRQTRSPEVESRLNVEYFEHVRLFGSDRQFPQMEMCHPIST
jgi:hypothetical protein